MISHDDLLHVIQCNESTVTNLESNLDMMQHLNNEQQSINDKIGDKFNHMINPDNVTFSLQIYPNYKCDATCYFCEMRKQPSGNLDVNDLDSFINSNASFINFDQIKLVTGEDFEFRYNWVQQLSKYFKSINVATKMICENDIDELISVCECYNVVLNVSYTTIENLRKLEKLLKYITSIEFVLNSKSLYELKDVVKWCNDNFVRLNVIPEVNITHESNPLNYDDCLKEFSQIDKEIGLVIMNQYRSMAYYGGDRCDNINKVMIDPYGDIYVCSASSTFFKDTPEVEPFGNIKEFQLASLVEKKILDVINVDNNCENCSESCSAKCSVYKMNDEVYNNMCVFNKVLHNLTKDLNVSRPQSMLPFVTTNCSLYCDYCFEHGTDSTSKSHMSTDVLLSCIKYGVLTDHDFEVSLFGGEPTLNVKALEDLCDFLENRCRYDKLSISIQTNLVYINDRVFDAFKRLSKCTIFRIDTSIDGCKTAHDLYRKNRLSEGSYDKVIKNIKRIKTELPDVQILAKGVMTKEIICYFVESCINAANLRMDGLIDSYMYTWYKGDSINMMPTDDDLQKMVDEYFNIIIPYTESKNFSVGELGLTSLGLDYYFTSSKVDDENYLFKNIRGSNSRTHIVTPDGTILPCEMFTNKDIYYQAEHYPNILFDGHFKKSIDINEINACELECFSCDLNCYCSRYMNHFKYQYDSQPNNVECSRRKKLLKMIYPYLSQRINKVIHNKLIDIQSYASMSETSIITLATTILSKRIKP